MSSREADLTSGLRALQVIWGTLFGGLVLAVVAALVASALWNAPLRAAGASLFYTAAILNLAALVWVFLSQHRLRDRLLRESDPRLRLETMHRHAQTAVLPLVAAGFFATMAAAGGGEAINLAFVVPIFGYGALFFPTRHRTSRVLPLEP
jgi:hypothetical protein